ncbi:hypothetical protein FE257_008791 [Aspergillus nanangensis]|uniref:Mog1p/PsbP-like protein n=1 Tax=Aspergillus nanangensis TaxID=2582783 RepID=A0AAD4GUD2_ASPNN|nr:hypothetical protein FE257_008791 [Aspergillus nanangensis]
MAITFTPQDFYGGAIKGTIPQDWIDASTLREIPDHQELFLSPTTLSSQIIEVNQYVPADEAADAPIQHLSTTSLDPAVRYHIHDLCDPGDKWESITAADQVTMARMPNVPAYSGHAIMTSLTRQRRGAQSESLGGAAAGSSAEGGLESKVSVHYLIVRLERQGTDLVVFFNVPHQEFGSEALRQEEELAQKAIRTLVGTLEIVDWGLFA